MVACIRDVKSKFWSQWETGSLTKENTLFKALEKPVVVEERLTFHQRMVN